MKNIIVIMLFALFSLGINAEENDSTKFQFFATSCRCHNESFERASVFGYKPNKYHEKEFSAKDTILFFGIFQIGNDIKDKTYSFLHWYTSNTVYTKELKNFSTIEDVPEITAYHNYHVLDSIAKDFKYGFIENWSWSTNSVDGIDFSISYTNTNCKTIKYIDIYFIIKNPVGDICKIYYNNGSNIGHLRCVGPIEQFETGEYSWDAVYYTTGSASRLHLTKFVITYMDNTKYTLVKELAYKY